MELKLWTVTSTLLVIANNHCFMADEGRHVNVLKEGTGAVKDTAYLTEAELKAQVKTLYSFITSQWQGLKSGNNNAYSEADMKSSHQNQIRQVYSGLGDTGKRNGICAVCQVFVGVLIRQVVLLGVSEAELIQFTTFACSFFNFALHPDVCRGAMERFIPILYFIIQNRPNLRPALLCGISFQGVGCRVSGPLLKGTEFDWSLQTLKRKSEEKVQMVKVENNTQRKVKKILHLSDIHYDPEYEEGTDEECDNGILCCHHHHQKADNGTKRVAGPFGSNGGNCDTPLKLLRGTFGHIRKTHGEDIDLIYITGDIVPHNVWYTSKELNTAAIQKVTKVLQEYFPTTPIIPALGNHEAHPINMFSPTDMVSSIPEGLRSDWLYEVTYDLWKGWIPPSGKETFLSSGHYAVDHANLRILVLNTNVCQGFNLWLLYDPQDPGGQLRWLEAQLEKSLLENKPVHIIAHVPPGDQDCWVVWSREFYALILKHRKIVKGQFYGHMHYDEFRILHDPDTRDAVSVLWIGPSLTPFESYNSAYRIYHICHTEDCDIGEVLEYESWVFNLDKANNESKDDEGDYWIQSYKATSQFGTDNLSPQNLKGFATQMAKNTSVFDGFYKRYFKLLPKQEEEDKRHSCDTICRKRLLCVMVEGWHELSEENDESECAKIQKEVDGSVVSFGLVEHRKRFLGL